MDEQNNDTKPLPTLESLEASISEISRKSEEEKEKLNNFSQNIETEKENISNKLESLSATITQKEEESSQRLQELSSSITQKEEESSQRLQELSSSITQKEEENSQRLQELSSSITQKEEENSQKLQELSSSITQKEEENSQKLQELSSAIARKEGENSQKLKDMSETIELKEEENSQTLKDISETIKLKEGEVEALIGKLEQRYSESNDGWNNDLKNIQAEWKKWKESVDKKAEAIIEELKNEKIKEFSGKVKEIEVDANTKIIKFDADMKEYISNAEEYYQKIKDIYKFAVDDSVAGSHKESAIEEEKVAARWRWISISFIGLAAVCIGGLYALEVFIETNKSFSILQTMKGFSLTGILLSGAFFSARQSNLHRANATRKLWFALETKAFDPFVGDLEQDDQRILKIQLIDRLFGQHEINSKGKSGKVNEYLIKLIKKKMLGKEENEVSDEINDEMNDE